METIQAQSTNTLSIPVRPQTGNIDPARQNQQVPAQDTDISQEINRPVQQPFEVEISTQAREQADAAASGTAQNSEAQRTSPSETQQAGVQSNAESGGIVNIVV